MLLISCTFLLDLRNKVFFLSFFISITELSPDLIPVVFLHHPDNFDCCLSIQALLFWPAFISLLSKFLVISLFHTNSCCFTCLNFRSHEIQSYLSLYICHVWYGRVISDNKLYFHFLWLHTYDLILFVYMYGCIYPLFVLVWSYLPLNPPGKTSIYDYFYGAPWLII